MVTRVINTGDAYSADSTVEFASPPRGLSLTVLNQPVLAQFKILSAPGERNLSAADWNPDEVEMIPGVWGWTAADFNDRPITGIRIRSQLPARSARVTVIA